MSLLAPFVKMGEFIFKAVKDVVGGTANITEILLGLVAYLPEVIESIKEAVDIKADGLTPQEVQYLIDDFLNQFDLMTGDTGVNPLVGIKRPAAEKILDHFKEMCRGILYAHYDINPSDWDNPV